MTKILLGLFSGIAFGFVIQRIGATSADKMARAHLMMESDIPKFMLTAVILSAVGLYGLQVAGVGRTLILPTSLLATGLAAVIFGIGWGLCGYCPGTAWAAVGEGRIDAVFAFLGGLAGAAVFAHFHEYLVPVIYDPTNFGRLTLVDGIPARPVALLILVVVFTGSVWAIDRLWGHRDVVR